MSTEHVWYVFIICKSFGGIDTQKVINKCDLDLEKVARDFHFYYKKNIGRRDLFIWGIGKKLF